MSYYSGTKKEIPNSFYKYYLDDNTHLSFISRELVDVNYVSDDNTHLSFISRELVDVNYVSDDKVKLGKFFSKKPVFWYSGI